jgi:hypothetical protein
MTYHVWVVPLPVTAVDDRLVLHATADIELRITPSPRAAGSVYALARVEPSH